MTNIYQKSINTLYPLLADFFKTYKSTFIVAICAGLLAHMYAYTNKLINIDEINHLFNLGHTIDSGRWGLSLLSFILPEFSIPWFNGIVSLIIFTLSGLLIIDTLHVKRKINKYLIVGLLVTFPSLTVTNAYMFTVLAYSIAFIFSLLPIWLLQKYSIRRLFVSIIFLVLSISIYQSYITCTASFILLVILNKTLNGHINSKDLRNQIILYFIFLILTLVIYFVLTWAILNILDIQMNGYAQGALTSKEPLGVKIRIIIFAIISEVFYHKFSILPTVFSSIMFICAYCCVIVMFTYWLINSLQSRWEKIIAILAIILMPVCINSISLLVDSYHIHSLVVYSFVFLLFVPIVILDATEDKFPSLKVLCIIFLSFLSIQYIYFANAIYLFLDLQYRQLYAQAIELVTDIRNFRQMDGGNSNVTIIGDFVIQNPNGTPFQKKFHIDTDKGRIMGIEFLDMSGNNLSLFIHNYVDATIPFISLSESAIDTIEISEEFKEMDSYPSSNSIKRIDDFIVVKLDQKE